MKSLINKYKRYTILITSLLVLSLSSLSQAQQFRALVISKTSGFRHKSITEGVDAIKRFAKKNRFSFYATED